VITGIVGSAVSTAAATDDADTKGVADPLDAVEAAGEDTGGCCHTKKQKHPLTNVSSLCQITPASPKLETYGANISRRYSE